MNEYQIDTHLDATCNVCKMRYSDTTYEKEDHPSSLKNMLRETGWAVLMGCKICPTCAKKILAGFERASMNYYDF